MTWQAPTPGQATLVGHVNQLLMTHAAAFTYNGAVIGTDPTLASASTQLGDTMLAQTITIANPVTLGSVLLSLNAIGAGQDVLVTLQADSGGYPSGVPLVGCVIPPEWLSVGTYTIPLPQSLAAGTYHIVIQPGSSLLDEFVQALAGINDVEWVNTTGTGGQIYSAGAWTDETFGFGVFLRDNTGTQLRAIADDALPDQSYPIPAKLASYAYSSGAIATAYEWVTRSQGVIANLLCRDDASFEVGLGSAADVSNASLSRTDVGLDGNWSLDVTASTAAVTTVQVGPYPVVAGDVYSAVASFLNLAGAASVTAQVLLAFYDGSTLVSTSFGSDVATSTSWQASTVIATAPATTTQAYVQFQFTTPATGAQYAVDGVGLFQSSSSVWSYPGIGLASVRALAYSDGSLISAT